MAIKDDAVNQATKGRPRGRPAVPLDRIVDAALEIVDERGPDALSMRAVAQRLGSGTATLYRHVADRAELVALMVDRMLGEVTTDTADDPRRPWDRVCVSYAHSMFDALSRHGNAASLLVGRVPMGPNAMAHRERLVALLLDNGFTPHSAARTYATLSRYILGFATQVSGSAESEHRDADISAEFGRLDPERYPATVTVSGHLPVPLAEEFSFGVELIVAGLTTGA